MGFEVSRKTADRLKALLGQGAKTGGLSLSGRPGGRHDLHVKITADAGEDGLYPCVPTHYDPVAEAWVEFEEQRAVSSNGGILTVGDRYRGICYGAAGDYLVFAADDAGTPETVTIRVPIEFQQTGTSPCTFTPTQYLEYTFEAPGLGVTESDTLPAPSPDIVIPEGGTFTIYVA